MTSRSWRLWVGVAAALILHGVPLGSGRTRNDPPGFAVPPAGPADTLSPAVFRQERLDPGSEVPSVHVASLCEPVPGQLAAVWYGGTREGAQDVAIFFATRTTNAAWSRPVPVVTVDSARRELDHFVRKVGNPVIYSDGRGRISLLFVAIAVGGWSGSSLCYKESFDQGRTWTPSRRWVLSPFFNISELVKNGPRPLRNGGWVVPIYHELFGKFPELLWLDTPAAPDRAIRTRPFAGRTAFQPALVALDAERALLLCRTAGSQRDLFVSRTLDGGRTWSSPQPTGLPNSDSGLDALRLASGRLLLAFNDTNSGRANLRLATSSDDGATWQRGPVIASEPGEEFSYPFLVQSQDGFIHLAYTWKRRAIQVATFNEAWVDAVPSSPTP